MVDLNTAAQWAMDAEGNVLDVNSGWVRLTGLSREKTRNLGWLEAVHPEDVQATMKALLEALHTGKDVDIEYRVKSADRGWRWMRSRGSPRAGSAGKIIRWYGSTEDIDELKHPKRRFTRFRSSPTCRTMIFSVAPLKNGCLRTC